MTVVVDANIAVLWTLEAPLTPLAVRLLRTEEGLIAPDLIMPEATNAFARYVRQYPERRARVMDGLEFLPRWFSELVPSALLRSKALDLALELNHSVYDCFYLALALARDVQLVTTDAHFLRKSEKSPHAASAIHLDDWHP